MPTFIPQFVTSSGVRYVQTAPSQKAFLDYISLDIELCRLDPFEMYFSMNIYIDTKFKEMHRFQMHLLSRISQCGIFQ